MNDFKRVAEALQQGADPEMLCSTCPWDRHCITPPSMTSEDIEREQAKMKRQDEETAAKMRAEGKDGGMPMGSLLGALMYAGKDTQAGVCPVFSARLRSSEGRMLADLLKKTMVGWDDSRVSA